MSETGVMNQSCSVCTYQNPVSALFCQMCTTPLGNSDGLSHSANEDVMSDAQLAESIQLEEFNHGHDDDNSSKHDFALAISLQNMVYEEELEDENENDGAAMAARSEQEAAFMLASPQGRAWTLIEQVVKLHARLKPDFEKIKREGEFFETVAVDDMVYLAEKIITCQENFRAAGKPASITVGYHTTMPVNMAGIRRDGLMSGPERQANGMRNRGGGATFGPGIYTGTNPYAFQHFGGVILMVATLKGASQRVGTRPRSQRPSNVDTVIGNKVTSSSSAHFNDEIVLNRSSQCLPLFSFSTTLVTGPKHQKLQTPASQLIWRLHQELQYILDEFLNMGEQVTPELILANMSGVTVTRIPRPNPAKMESTAPDETSPPSSGSTALNYLQGVLQLLFGQTAPPPSQDQTSPSRQTPAPVTRLEGPPTTGTFAYSAPSTLGTKPPASYARQAPNTDNKECSVCLSALSSSVVQLVQCKHFFHEECLDRALQHHTVCPICRKPVVEPRGKSPSGTMTVSINSQHCRSFDDCGTIQIQYTMPGDKQKPYHENPGTTFSSCSRTAYLPDNQDGRKLLKRLKYAWSHGLTFTVGTSLTTGRKNVVTWASVHHKTSLSGGVHGFPDPGYFMNCNDELDGLGVPPSQDC